MNIDQLYQQKTAEFELTNSNKDLHWQQMQLQIAKSKKQKRLKKVFLLSSSLILTGFLIISLLHTNNKSETSNTQVASENNTQSTQSKTSIAEPVTKKASIQVSPTIKKADKSITTRSSVKKTENNTIQKVASFYIDLSKEPQLFEVDAQMGGSFTCKQGTVITLPAGIVVDSKNNIIQEKITLIVQEYYRYDDAESNIPDAGMVKYELYKNNEKLFIEQGKSIGIKMQNDIKHFKVLNEMDALPEKKLQQLNWATSDRFYTDQRAKIDYKITLAPKYNANTFMSQLIFPKYNVALPGSIDKNSLNFTSIPVGETIYFVSLGKVGNKYFSCTKKLISGNTEINELDFIEISETLYKQQIELYSKLGKGE